ncbi:hypothetical protein LZK31_24255 (plasmid) [Salmonella enterica subsp. enterica serovar Goldcoast]|nr:hypothetical protein LZK31_22695 [Salmonella enterica subsp. enterica serovar Goldcoast]UIL36746.1 hypothetical protein LZK31_24255 [Salmonella enterica subsp. enterica serovar Goldcoast]
MLGGADNPNGELPSYITGADINDWQNGCGGSVWGSRLRAQENCRHYRRHCCGIWLPSGTI